MKNKYSPNASFTLIELLIVIAIIGILAALIIVALNTVLPKTRDAQRQNDLRNVEKALEMYYTTNQSYPSTGGNWWGYNYISNPHPLSGTNGYIPNLAPTYMPTLPLDPRDGTNGITTDTGQCPGGANGSDPGYAHYLYRSNGTDYKFIAWCTPESYPANNPFFDPQSQHSNNAWAVFTPGAAQWY